MSDETINNDYMLTTYDNPFNPFTEFELWFKYDMLLGYNTCALLNQTAALSFVQSQELNEKDSLEAIDYIVSKNPFVYKKVLKSDFD